MVESLNLQNFTVDDNGRVIFSGAGSGINFTDAVDSIIAARRIPVDRLEAKVELNNERLTAFDDLRALLNTFKDTLDTLRGKVTFGGAGNIFKAKEIFATSSNSTGTASAAGALVGVSATNAAATGGHSLEVLQVAEAHKLSAATANSNTDDLGLAFGGSSGSVFGSFEINGTRIDIEATDSLVDLADRINTANAGTNATGVTASIVSVDANQHILVLTADDTGKSIAIANSHHTSGLVTDNTAQLDSYTNVTGAGNTFDIRDGADNLIGTVTYDNTDTLQTLEAKIDAISGVTGTILAEGSEFRLIIVSDDGSSIKLNNDSLGANGVLDELGFPGDVLADLGISTDGGATFTNELRTAQNARFRADGLIDTAASQSSAVATATTAFNVSGNVSIELPDTTLHNVAVIVSDTPTTLEAKINGETALQDAGITASVIQDDDGNFRVEIRQSELTTTDPGAVLAVRSDDPAVDTVGITDTLTFAFDNGQIAAIAVAAAETLNDVRDNINADLSLQDAGVTASVVQDGTQFKLVIQHDPSLNATGPAGLGLTTPALIVERQSNTIDDLFNGLTISLFQPEVGTTINLDIEQDLTDVKTAITDFVTAYNDFKIFINEQRLTDPATGSASDDAGALFANPTLGNIEQSLSRLLGAGAQGLDSGLRVLSEIGVTFVDNNSLSEPLLANTLTVDETLLDEALLNDPEGVRRLFEFDFTSSDPRVAVLGFGGQTEVKTGGYTLDITVTAGVITAATIDGVSNSITISGNTLTATNATTANGLVLLYNGTTSASNINLDFSTGVGHELFFDIDRILENEIGALDAEVDNLKGQNELAQSRIDNMLERLAAERERLLARFAAMEAALATLNNTLETVKQQFAALEGNRN